MIISLNEKIVAGVLFQAGNIKPLWFLYKNAKIIIKEVCYKWKEREGGDIIYKFTVRDDANIYELAYSTMSGQWFLLAIDEEVF
jgi:hypothetical protein